MKADDNINMNSSRPYEMIRNNLIQEKEEKIKDLIEKNEKMEKDCLKLQFQLKKFEEKLKIKSEKEYVSNTNTSSNFLLPSEFKKLWEDFANTNLSDCFIDFYDDPIITFHLTHEIFIITIELFREQIKIFLGQVLTTLNVPNEKNNYKQFEICLKPIFQEFFHLIFESEKTSEIFLSNVKKKYEKFVYEELENFEKEDEMNDLLSNKCFKDLISTIKKIVLYIEFHNPSLKLKVDSFRERKIERKKFKNSDCICVEGLVKENKKCLIILNPPVLKNGYAYHGLKPIVMVSSKEIPQDMLIDISMEEDKNVENSKNFKNLKDEVKDKSFIENTESEKNLDLNIVNSHLEKYLLENKVKTNVDNSSKNNSPNSTEKKENTSQRHLFGKKSQEKVLNISDSLNFELKMTKDISPIKHSPVSVKLEEKINQNDTIENVNKNNENLDTIGINDEFKYLEIENKKNQMKTENLSNKLYNLILENNNIEIKNNNHLETKQNYKKNYLLGMNFRSSSHHNLIYDGKEKFENSKLSKIVNPNVKGISNIIITNNNSSINEAYNNIKNNEINYNNYNLNDLLNTNNSYLKEYREQEMKTQDKIENFISSRSHYESNNADFNMENFDINENYYEFENLGTDYNNKILTTSLSNSFSMNKNDLMSTLNHINIGSLNFDRDNLSNTSDYNYHNKTTDKINTKKISNLVSNILINSDKKSNKGNLLLYQSTERGVNTDTLSKTLEKYGTKGNPVIIKAGSNRQLMRSLSKTPKQNKPKVIGYSPRNNVHYIFHDNLSGKQNLPNNIIIKVAKKSQINKLNNNFLSNDDRNTSKNSSVSKEKKMFSNNMNYYTSTKNLEEVSDINNTSKINNLIKLNKTKLKSNTGNSNFFFKKENIINNISSNNILNKNKSYLIKPVEEPKKKIIQKDKDYINQSGNKKTNKSIDRRILTNAQTKLCVDDLLSFKKNEKSRASPIHFIKEKNTQNNLETKNTKGNFINIKYV